MFTAYFLSEGTREITGMRWRWSEQVQGVETVRLDRLSTPGVLGLLSGLDADETVRIDDGRMLAEDAAAWVRRVAGRP